jgi:hypothetical protein
MHLRSPTSVKDPLIKFGFTPEKVIEAALQHIEKNKSS